jgi:hypothetical protein
VGDECNLMPSPVRPTTRAPAVTPPGTPGRADRHRNAL